MCSAQAALCSLVMVSATLEAPTSTWAGCCTVFKFMDSGSECNDFFTDFHFPFKDSFYDTHIEHKDYYDNIGITKSIL